MTTEETKPLGANEPCGDPESRLAPFNPSSKQIQEKALDMLQLSSDDVLFDLGCGDGRLLFHAAEKIEGLRCIGIEMNPIYVARALETIPTLPADIQQRVDIRQGDVLKQSHAETSDDRSADTKSLCTNLSVFEDATAIYLFILPEGIVKIMPLLDSIVAQRKKEKKSLRVLSYMFKIRDWIPSVTDSTSKGGLPVYLYQFDS